MTGWPWSTPTPTFPPADMSSTSSAYGSLKPLLPLQAVKDSIDQSFFVVYGLGNPSIPLDVVSRVEAVVRHLRAREVRLVLFNVTSDVQGFVRIAPGLRRSSPLWARRMMVVSLPEEGYDFFHALQVVKRELARKGKADWVSFVSVPSLMEHTVTAGT